MTDQLAVINVLCIGDVVGKPGRSVILERLPGLIKDRRIDLVVCNAENIAGGSGMTPGMFASIHQSGVDVATMGDHVFRRREIYPLLQSSNRVVRPANISPAAVGRGWTVVSTKSGAHRAGVFSLLGQMSMGNNDSPWQAADRVLHEIPDDVPIRILDFHAEASSEKIAMGWHLNGRASIVFGTHTHTPTADARVLDGGTAFVSDVGMTGPYDSVLGRKKERVLSFLTTSMPTRFDVADGDIRLVAVLVGVEPTSGRAVSIERIEVQGAPCTPGPDAEDHFGAGGKESD